MRFYKCYDCNFHSIDNDCALGNKLLKSVYSCDKWQGTDEYGRPIVRAENIARIADHIRKAAEEEQKKVKLYVNKKPIYTTERRVYEWEDTWESMWKDLKEMLGHEKEGYTAYEGKKGYRNINWVLTRMDALEADHDLLS